MKSVVTILAVFAVMTAVATAQQTGRIEPESAGSTIAGDNLPLPIEGEASVGAGAVEQGFIWQTAILRRYDATDDTNRRDYNVPQTFTSGRQLRGIGQIFAPSAIYSYYYDPRIYNEDSQILLRDRRFPDNRFNSDLEYVQQFKDAKSYIIDSLRFYVYRRDQAIPQNDGKIIIYSTTTDFNGSAYKQRGFHAPRTALQSLYTRTLTPEELDTTWQNIDGNGRIFPRVERFAPDNPLLFAAGESAVVMYINDDAPSVVSPAVDADIQRIKGTLEYRTGDIEESGSTVVDTRGDSLIAYKSLGVVLYRGAVDKKDTIHSAWTNLFTFDRPALYNMDMVVWGSVDLQSGVRYHFGADATSQGLEQATPNPVTAGNARLPFTLSESSDVTIDLFDANGGHVAALVTGHYVPGRYSVAIPADGLPGGIYLARMVAGEKIYTMTIAVSK